MFTDRFIKLPITVYNLQAEELGLDDINEMEATVRLDPNQIESYNDAIKDGHIVVSLTTKSGDTFAVYMNIREFERKLNEFERGAACFEREDIDNSKTARQ